MAELEDLKQQAALRAVEHVKSGMRIGLGTGSTAKYAIEAIGERFQAGELKNITAIATSKASETLAASFGIPKLELHGQTLDVAIDGMDELDPDLNAIKGLGGALTREKIVEACADVLILIADGTKLVKRLGEKAPIAVEVLGFAWRATEAKLQALGLRPERRMNEDEAFVTDNNNYILDCHVYPPIDAQTLATNISIIPGVVEHGLFLDMAKLAYIAHPDKVVRYEREGA